MNISNKIKTISDALLNKHNFALVYISALLLRSVFFLQVYVDIVCKICLFWGILIALCDLIKYKGKFFKAADSFLPLILCVSYAVSIALNYGYSLYGGIKNLMYLGIYFFVLLSIRYDGKKEDFYKFIKRNNDVFIAINTLIGIASIITFLFSVKTIYHVGTDAYKVGFWFNRLNGVCNSNMETVMGLVSVALCIINLYLCKGKIGKIKILYIANFVVQFIYYSLSGSRAATICYAVMAVIIIAFWGYPVFKNRFGNLKAILCVALSVVILLVGEFGLTKATQFMMKNATYGVNLIMGIDNNDDNSINFQRVEDFENGDITNNRAAMWTAAFKIIKQFPAFGVAYASQMDIDGNINPKIDASVFDEKDLSALNAAGFYFHNGFVQMILCGGIVFFAIFMLFVIKKAWKFIKYLFKRDNKKSKYYVVVVILFALIASLLVDNIVEVHIMFSGQDSVAAILWYTLGCGLFIIDSEKKIEVAVDE
ncbi:MAG: O-antigen ligase family protein [Ruminococcaceae bacterium]|nr:O-antigen ligase family protein [Oscillospiraceae bacterium]